MKVQRKMSNIFDLFKKIEKSSVGTGLPISHIVVGLGNPGDKYANTRHNAGFMALDAYSKKHGFRLDRLKHKALCGEAVVSGKRVLFMKPQTYMNNSGDAVRDAASFYKIPAENIVVIFDDISLDPGKIRIRKKGSAGGHNGIKSIIEKLNSELFPRIKLGVGSKPHPDYDLADWVLSNFPKDQEQSFSDTLDSVGDALDLILGGCIDTAMSKFN